MRSSDYNARPLLLVRAGDVIVAVDQKRISTPGDLVSALDDRTAGETVSLGIRRDAGGGNGGREMSLRVQLQEELS